MLYAGWYTCTQWDIVVNITQDSLVVPGVYQTGLYLHIMHANSHWSFEITKKVIIMISKNIEIVAVEEELAVIRAWQEKLAD